MRDEFRVTRDEGPEMSDGTISVRSWRECRGRSPYLPWSCANDLGVAHCVARRARTKHRTDIGGVFPPSPEREAMDEAPACCT